MIENQFIQNRPKRSNTISYKDISDQYFPETSQIHRKSERVPEIVNTAYQKISEIYEQLQSISLNLQSRIGFVIQKEQAEFFEKYNIMLRNLKTELDEYKKKVEENDAKLQKDATIKILNKELEYYKEETAKNAKNNLVLRQEINKLISDNKSLENEIMFCEKRLKDTKRKNKALRMALNRFANENENSQEIDTSKISESNAENKQKKENCIDFNLRFDSFIESIEKYGKDEIILYCKTYFNQYSKRSDEIINMLKSQINLERKAVLKLRASQVDTRLNNNELLQIFTDCIEEAKKYFQKPKNSPRVHHISNFTPIQIGVQTDLDLENKTESKSPKLCSSEKLKIVEQFLNNEKLLQALYKTVFDTNIPVRSKLNSSMNFVSTMKNYEQLSQKICGNSNFYSRKTSCSNEPKTTTASRKPFIPITIKTKKRVSISSYSFPRRSINVNPFVGPPL